jgi:hypothetical protein
VCLALLEKDVIPEWEVSVGGGRWHAAKVYIVVAVRCGWGWTDCDVTQGEGSCERGQVVVVVGDT